MILSCSDPTVGGASLASDLSLLSRVQCFAWLYTNSPMGESWCQGEEKGLLSEVRIRRKLASILTSG